MRILVVTQYFWPEAFPINALVRALAESGCTITVLTGQPNYPNGVVFPGYHAARISRERHEHGYTIHRLPLVPRGRATAFRLAANYTSFVLSATVFGPWLLKRARFDVIFVYAPSPILQAIPAIVLKWLKRAPLVTWVQDLWPQSLDSTGFVRNRHVLAMVETLVRWIYRRNDLLLAQSPSFVAAIEEISGATPVRYFPNPGEAARSSSPLLPEPALVLEQGFNVVFAGNLGTVQDLRTVLDAAHLLREERAIRFVLIGSGSRSGWLKSEIAERRLMNVRLPGRFEPAEMPAILAQASVLLVCLVRSPIMSRTIPAKVQAYLAAGRPIIASLEGDGARVIDEAGAGISVSPEDPRALADAVVRLRSCSDGERLRMGDNGRRFYQRHFTPNGLARQLIAHFQEMIPQPRSAPSHHPDA